MDTIDIDAATAEHATVFTFPVVYDNGTPIPTTESVEVVLDGRDRDHPHAWAVRHLGMVWHRAGRWAPDPDHTAANVERFGQVRFDLPAALTLAASMRPAYTDAGRPAPPLPQEHPDV